MKSLVLGFATGLAAALGGPAPLWAEADQGAVHALWITLGQPQIIEIMHEEGKVYGSGIATEMFPDRAGADWDKVVSEIYDTDRMTIAAEAAFTASIGQADIPAIMAFLDSPLGHEIIQLEISARRAMLDDTIDAAAKEAAALALTDDTPRHQQITRFVEANDLVETNVVGAMNANYAFYLGLMDGGAMPGELTQDQILTDVWTQEPDIRSSTGEWVYSFLTLAYQPLEDAELDEYIAFTQTEAGQDMNRALFAAYDQLFVDISRALGLAAAQSLKGADL